jgi:hypothetical protein
MMALLAVCTDLGAQQRASDELLQVTVNGLSHPVEESYRKMVQGLDH